MTPSKAQAEYQLLSNLWNKYTNAMNRGHREYTFVAHNLENMYLGGIS